MLWIQVKNCQCLLGAISSSTNLLVLLTPPNTRLTIKHPKYVIADEFTYPKCFCVSQKQSTVGFSSKLHTQKYVNLKDTHYNLLHTQKLEGAVAVSQCVKPIHLFCSCLSLKKKKKYDLLFLTSTFFSKLPFLLFFWILPSLLLLCLPSSSFSVCLPRPLRY